MLVPLSSREGTESAQSQMSPSRFLLVLVSVICLHARARDLGQVEGSWRIWGLHLHTQQLSCPPVSGHGQQVCAAVPTGLPGLA